MIVMGLLANTCIETASRFCSGTWLSRHLVKDATGGVLQIELVGAAIGGKATRTIESAARITSHLKLLPFAN